MQAIDHNTYADYVAYTKGRGYSVIPQDLYDALKEQDAMYERFKEDMAITVDMVENINDDGSINWNFVDSDMYHTWSVVLDGEQYTEWFEASADIIERIDV